MKNNLLLSLHEKAIAVLEAYYKAERLYNSHKQDMTDAKNGHLYTPFFNGNYVEKRMYVNAAIMARLQAYYTRIIDKINQHKP